MFDYLIVGAGFAGCVLAERLARGSGQARAARRQAAAHRRQRLRPLRRAGILVHQYGPHIFHTNSREVFDYLSRFTEWRPYEHRVRAASTASSCRSRSTSTPSTRSTALKLDVVPARGVLPVASPSRATRSGPRRTSIVSKVGRELYEKFFRNYTRKQWGLDPSELDAAVTARVPDPHQPRRPLFHRRLPGDAAARLHADVRAHARSPEHQDRCSTPTTARSQASIRYDEVIYTGPIDEYFDYRFGKLPYRSLRVPVRDADDRAGFSRSRSINYPNEHAVHPGHRVQAPDRPGAPEDDAWSTNIRSAEGDPYYPVPRPENAALYKQYQALADATPRRALRRPAGHLQVLQHGPGRRPVTGPLSTAIGIDSVRGRRRSRLIVTAHSDPGASVAPWLAADERVWAELAERAATAFGTPCYVSRWSPVVKAVETQERHFAGTLVRSWLSFKTHPVSQLAQAWLQSGRGVEVVSEAEFVTARRLGCAASQLLVNGVAKHMWLGKHSTASLRVHFDSRTEIAALLPSALRDGWQVGIRCHVPAERDAHDASFGGQFGLSEVEADEACGTLQAAGLPIHGLHFHLGQAAPAIGFLSGVNRLPRVSVSKTSAAAALLRLRWRHRRSARHGGRVC